MADASRIKVVIPVTRMMVMAAHVYFPVCMSKCTKPAGQGHAEEARTDLPLRGVNQRIAEHFRVELTPCSTRDTRPSGVQR